MPNYTYHCTNEDCDAMFDALASIQNRDIPRPCPYCSFVSERTMADNMPIYIIPYGKIGPGKPLVDQPISKLSRQFQHIGGKVTEKVQG